MLLISLLVSRPEVATSRLLDLGVPVADRKATLCGSRRDTGMEHVHAFLELLGLASDSYLLLGLGLDMSFIETSLTHISRSHFSWLVGVVGYEVSEHSCLARWSDVG